VTRSAVMDRDGWECQLCGSPLLESFCKIPGTNTPHPRSPTIDHIIPLSHGAASPGHVFDNCQAACWQCNCQRGAESVDSFARRKATR
jgi:5-methylcytosine-specific restriction endonuclease McrA